MKMLKITHQMVEGLEFAECKQEFINTLKSMLKDHEPTTNSRTTQALGGGLKSGFPDLRIRVTFDTYKLEETEYTEYHLIEEGYFPVDLDCKYEDYEYRYLGDMSDSEITAYYKKVVNKIRNSTGDIDEQIFFQYIREAFIMNCLDAGRHEFLGFFAIL